MKQILIASLFLFCAQWSCAQYYAYGGYEYSSFQSDELDAIVAEFNDREAHSLGNLRALHGYRFGIGRYAELTDVALGFGYLGRKLSSVNPQLLKETAELEYSLISADASIGYRPFKSKFHSIGASLHMGQMRYRYSFGGDYLVPIKTYNIWGEIYAELAFPFRFLLKKEQRDRLFYIFKIRPFYRVYRPLDLYALQRDFNLDQNVGFNQINQKGGQFGLRLSIVVPFLTKEEQVRYSRNPKAAKRAQLEKKYSTKTGAK
ncbi:hypothetical protein PPO43_11835 [Saprospira sp. CCB-QB6]|uniref:hypothetical protein n=1 Tax=Saprospira sp. CCB-QB6 TaxID=3023936 RepID=UPI00234B3F6E|nr:hypothetical protein [Saprospira sp. CCB-QB6]WCL80660.1 hypothetical protein PPO43_11835 [Saprospira sp. CCB-QB6]